MQRRTSGRFCRLRASHSPVAADVPRSQTERAFLPDLALATLAARIRDKGDNHERRCN